MAHPLPELGGHGLHIAHLLWGGFFIDELGKFITQDNDYFFKPAALSERQLRLGRELRGRRSLVLSSSPPPRPATPAPSPPHLAQLTFRNPARVRATFRPFIRWTRARGTLRGMWILIAVLVLAVVVVAVVVLSGRTGRPKREPDWPGAHDTSARDHHFSGGSHGSGGYGGGAGEAGPGGHAG